MNWSWLSKLSPAPVFDWLNRMHSNDPSASNSRVLQTLIVVNLVAILWLVVAHAGWVITDNTRLIAITMVVSGAGSYVASKAKEGS